MLNVKFAVNSNSYFIFFFFFFKSILKFLSRLNISIVNLHSAVPGVTSSTELFFGLLLPSWYEVSVGTSEMLGSSSQFLTMPTERFLWSFIFTLYTFNQCQEEMHFSWGVVVVLIFWLLYPLKVFQSVKV